MLFKNKKGLLINNYKVNYNYQMIKRKKKKQIMFNKGRDTLIFKLNIVKKFINKIIIKYYNINRIKLLIN